MKIFCMTRVKKLCTQQAYKVEYGTADKYQLPIFLV